jgi:Cd2+/Zn2+-exporting ATPase
MSVKLVEEKKESCSCDHCNVDFSKELKSNSDLDVRIIDKKDKGIIAGNFEFSRNVMRIGIGGLLFISGIILKKEDFSVLLFIFSYMVLGYEVIINALKNLFKGKIFDENFLMTVASIGAIIIGEYPEAAGVMLFFSVGEHLQDMAVDNSRKSIKALLNIKPDYANLEQGKHTLKVSPDKVKIGDVLVIKPGEKIPVDGSIIEGNSSVDTSPLTGEHLPRDVKFGDAVLAGCVNLNGMIRIKASKTFGESTASRILKLVEEASQNKAKTENFITKFAKYYTPAVVFAALIIALAPSLVIYGEITKEWIYRGLIFLVVSCPCALVLSIPLAYFGGIGAASKKGILVKGGNYLEALVSADRVIFDKTGTLTEGKFTVSEINPVEGTVKDELLYYGAYGEYYSNHPIAESIKRKYGKTIEKENIESHNELAGFGIKCKVNNEEVLVGNYKLMESEGVKGIIATKNGVDTVAHVSVNGIYKGYIAVEDTIKESSIGVVNELKKQGIREVIMLTGDHELAAHKTAERLGLDSYHYGLLPDEKLDILREYLNNETKTIAVGDGINDAPLLAGADIGFAMGALGSDAAIEAADIVLMTDEPSKIAESIKIAHMTRRIVWQNIAFALGVKGLVMILSTFGLAAMYQAVFADVGVALIAVINSTRILK